MKEVVNSQREHGIRAFLCFVIVVVFVAGSLGATNAIMPMPKIGIDYKKMEVESTTILKAEGMKDVEKGDSVDVHFSDDRTEIIVKNKRTGETIAIDLTDGSYYR